MGGGVDHKIFKKGFPYLRIYIRPQALNQPVPVVVRVLNDIMENLTLAGEHIVFVEFIRPIQQLRQAFTWIFIHVMQYLLHRKGLEILSNDFLRHPII